MPDLNLPYKEKEESSDIASKLIAFGCRACYIFALVLENNQKCPKCRQSITLFNDFDRTRTWAKLEKAYKSKYLF